MLWELLPWDIVILLLLLLLFSSCHILNTQYLPHKSTVSELLPKILDLMTFLKQKEEPCEEQQWCSVTLVAAVTLSYYSAESLLWLCYYSAGPLLRICQPKHLSQTIFTLCKSVITIKRLTSSNPNQPWDSSEKSLESRQPKTGALYFESSSNGNCSRGANNSKQSKNSEKYYQKKLKTTITMKNGVGCSYMCVKEH